MLRLRSGIGEPNGVDAEEPLRIGSSDYDPLETARRAGEWQG